MSGANILNLIQPKNLGLGNSQYWERVIKPEEIKALLDANDDVKITEGLKLLIAAMSKGANVQHLFPSIVILVHRKNPEIKKMVYICLGHYSELEPSTALLAINILEKDLAQTNQLIRAHALRTISTIRVRIITQLVVAGVVGGTKDSSPYVRKTAAHAILKVYSMDPSQKDLLVEAIEKLLSDRENMVLGSAVAAFNEVCPDNFGLIHKHFRKLCDCLVDTDEWGQQHILTMLTRYGRSQFLDPEKVKEEKEKKPEEEKDEDDEDGFMSSFNDTTGYNVEPDHRILLDSCLPLLRSRSVGVVMAVATLYQYLAPKPERHKVAKPLVRCLREGREYQYVILTNIHTMAQADPTLFQPFITEFFIGSWDPTFTRTLKLDILTLLANESNIDRILREFKFYATQEDKEFVAKTIQAIGKCTMRLPEVTERCMTHLLQLLSSKKEIVVAESVVVLKQLLQMPREEQVAYDEVIKQLTRLFTVVTNAKARASIIWVVGEYVDVIKAYAPDILRQLAKQFPTEDDAVKIQILNLAAKLLLTNPEQTTLLAQYIFLMAKFDINYDIRDKARMYRYLLFPEGENKTILQQHVRQLLITTKPSPKSEDLTGEKAVHRFTIGSLSHLLKQTTHGYTPLPDWATEPTDAELRKPPVMSGPSYVNSLNPYGVGGKYTGFGSENFPRGGPPPQNNWQAGRAQQQRSFDADLNAFLADEDYDGEYEDEYWEEDGEYEEGEYDGEYEDGEYEGEYEDGEYEGEYEDGEYEDGEYEYEEEGH